MNASSKTERSAYFHLTKFLVYMTLLVSLASMISIVVMRVTLMYHEQQSKPATFSWSSPKRELKLVASM